MHSRDWDCLQIKTTVLTSEMAVAFAITYVFGTVGVIIFLRSIAPRMMGRDVKQAARELEAELSEGGEVKRPGYITPFVPVVARAFVVKEPVAVGRTVAEVSQHFGRASIEQVLHHDEALEPKPDLMLEDGDIVGVAGRLGAVVEAGEFVGPEVESKEALSFSIEVSSVMVTNKQIVGKTLGNIRDELGEKHMEGVYLVSIKRQGLALPLMLNTVVQRGDVAQIAGRPGEVQKVGTLIGRAESTGGKSDLAYHAVAIALGIILGLLSVDVAGIPVTLGVGGGVLVSGLFFGWLHAKYPVFGALPQAAQTILSDFGLSAFAALVGLSAGPKASGGASTGRTVSFLWRSSGDALPNYCCANFWPLRIEASPRHFAGCSFWRTNRCGFAQCRERGY